MKNIFFFSIILAFCISCSTTEMDCICTEEFRFYTVTILDDNNQPVDSMNVKIKNKNSGQEYQINQSNFIQTGQYIVMDDSQTKILCNCDQTVLFIAEKDSINITAEYSFYVDDCRCHVYKNSGPDTIRVN